MNYDELIVHIGKSIRAERRAQGLTGKQLADKMRSCERMLNDLELGKVGGRIRTYHKIADVLGVDIKQLMP